MTADYIDEKNADRLLALLQPKNALVCKLCIETGLRIGDAVAIESKKLKSQRVFVKEQKTGKTRRIYIKKGLFLALLAQKGRIFVFESPTDATRHLTRQAVWTDVKKCAHALGIEKNVSPHSFRKLYAVRLLNRYKDLKKVQRIIGHDSIALTVMYATSNLFT